MGKSGIACALEGFRPKQAQVLLARLRDAVLFPSAHGRLFDPANAGHRAHAPEVPDDVGGKFLSAHAPDYRGSDRECNRQTVIGDG